MSCLAREEALPWHPQQRTGTASGQGDAASPDEPAALLQQAFHQAVLGRTRHRTRRLARSNALGLAESLVSCVTEHQTATTVMYTPSKTPRLVQRA
ncbi:hypothetical protein HPB50_026489 [Hyalomma asiaticum]|uniref:Uncharacterized protein n=1 Tax=Hyalomma asiaticum TaxID=266040 RepID=A0ACB7SU55_HYAAI|nr:hypothetical protein HPB50_026489 [Hyalomma asiaticum]